MLKIGITGGIGSGKSIICRIFNQLHIPVFNADLEARNILLNSVEAIDRIKQTFGKEIIVNNKPDRKLLGQLVFNNPVRLKELNAIIHPLVQAVFEKWCANQNAPYILKEAAILFEVASYKSLDKNILVIAPENLRIKRVINRDGITEELVRNRMNNQWADKEKIKLADYIINNDDEHLVIPQVLNIHKEILTLSQK